MPPSSKEPGPQKTIDEVVEEIGLYPIEAYEFVQRGLAYAVRKIHGEQTNPDANRHVSGQQLCEGLREFALAQWGLLARTVLRRWNIYRTEDFGRIVFAMVNNGFMQKTPHDSLADFQNVYDFASALVDGYKITCREAQA